MLSALKEEKKTVDSLMAILSGNPLQPRVANSNAPTQRIELSDNQGIILWQNDPNPFKESTTINYFIPNEVKEAKILFSDNKGSILRTAKIDSRGDGTLEV